MNDLGKYYILSFIKLRATSYGISSFSHLSAKLKNALPDFIRTTEFSGFKRDSMAAFCEAAFLFN